MAEERQEEVVIVGGGIAGLATAVALQHVGIRSLVLERHHELRATGAALTLFPNAWRALNVLGVADKLTPMYQAIQKGLITNIADGTIQEVTLSGTSNSLGVRSVHRKALLEALAGELAPGTIRFSSSLASIKTKQVDPDSPTVQELRLEDGAVIRAKVLIGCDGVHSMVAQWLGLTAPIDSGRSCVRGLATFPEGHGFKHEVQQYVGVGMRAAFIPLNDRDIYWFFGGTLKEMARDPEMIQKEVLETLAKDLPSDYLNVVRHSDLPTVTREKLMFRRPWDLIIGCTHQGSVVVAGDALHPMTPDLGQGGCLALEDAVVLGRSIGSTLGKGKVEEGIEQYVMERRWRVAGLITGAYLSGWVQQGGSGIRGWAVRWFRDHVFYRYIFPMTQNAVNFDCGDLPISKE